MIKGLNRELEFAATHVVVSEFDTTQNIVVISGYGIREGEQPIEDITIHPITGRYFKLADIPFDTFTEEELLILNPINDGEYN